MSGRRSARIAPRMLFITTLGVAFVATAAIRTTHGPPADEPPRTPSAAGRAVRVVVAELGCLRITEDVLGRVEYRPDEVHVVSARAGGQVDAVLTSVGANVDRGTVLAQLDDAIVGPGVRRARALLAAARARVDEFADAGAQIRTRELGATRDQSAADAALAAARAARRVDLADRGLISRVAADESSAEAERLRMAADGARRVYDAWTAGGAQRAEVIARAELDAAQADLDAAVRMAADTEIRSPVSGTVTEWFARPGELLAPGQALGVVVHGRATRIRAAVAPAVAHRIELGAEVRSRDADGATPLGHVTTVEPDVDPSTGLVIVLADDEGSTRRAGEWVRVSIVIETIRDAVLVPESALRADADHVVVATVDETGHTRMIAVEVLGGQHGTCALRGIDADARVIVDGAFGLLDGSAVEIE